MSIAQLRGALEANNVVPTIVIQFYESSPSSPGIIAAYNALKTEIPLLQVRAFDIQTLVGEALTNELINIIEDAYNVSE